MLKTIFRNTLVSLGLIAKPALTVRYAAAQPARNGLNTNEIVVVGEKHAPKWAVMRCPGNCGLVMRLPLDKSKLPSWTVTRDWLGRVTATPSVHQKNACHAHFWIRKGKVVWCRDSGCGQN